MSNRSEANWLRKRAQLSGLTRKERRKPRQMQIGIAKLPEDQLNSILRTKMELIRVWHRTVPGPPFYVHSNLDYLRRREARAHEEASSG